MTIYIYALYCPTTGEPRYIGKTKKPDTRLAGHVCKAKGNHTTHHCANWIRELLKEGKRPILKSIFEVPAGEAWQPHEKRLIAEYRAAGYPLTNLTGGGDGFFGMSAESLASRGQTRSAQLAIPEVKEKFRESMRAGHGAPAAREAHKRGAKNAWNDPEKRAAFLAGMNAPEAKARRAEATRRRYEDPAELEAHADKMKAIWSTPERREEARLRSVNAWADPVIAKNRVAAVKAAYAKPEVREKISQASKASWALRKAAAGKCDVSHDEPRWTDEKRAAQAARLAEPERAAKIKAKLSDPELIKRRNAAIKAAWARRKAETA